MDASHVVEDDDQHPDRETPFEHVEAADQEDQAAVELRDQPETRGEEALLQAQTKPGQERAPALVPEPGLLPLLLPERLHDAQAREDLLGNRLRRALQALHTQRSRLEVPAIETDRGVEEGRGQQSQQRELRIQADDHPQDTDERQTR